MQRDSEKERKAREREVKQLERQKLKELLEVQKQRKREEFEQKRTEKQAPKLKQPAKGKKAVTKTFITRSKARAGDAWVCSTKQ